MCMWGAVTRAETRPRDCRCRLAVGVFLVTFFGKMLNVWKNVSDASRDWQVSLRPQRARPGASLSGWDALGCVCSPLLAAGR